MRTASPSGFGGTVSRSAFDSCSATARCQPPPGYSRPWCGTGKTTLVNGIIQILEKKRRILLEAPTGRAAKRMTEPTGREAKALHRLLEFDPKTMGFLRDR
jgi:hypothetical protein